LCWEITDHPEDAFSRRFVPGSDGHAAIRHEIWDDNNLGNAIPGCTPRARIALRRAGLLDTLEPEGPVHAPGGGRLYLDTRVRNLTRRPFAAQGSHGRRLVRLGAQLARMDGTMLNRDYARAWLPQTLA